MKNICKLLIIASLFYLPIHPMELATSISLDDKLSDETVCFLPKKFDWISEEKQKAVVTSLLSFTKIKSS